MENSGKESAQNVISAETTDLFHAALASAISDVAKSADITVLTNMPAEIIQSMAAVALPCVLDTAIITLSYVAAHTSAKVDVDTIKADTDFKVKLSELADKYKKALTYHTKNAAGVMGIKFVPKP